MNPAGQVPAIEDDGFYLAECHAIAKYLCEKCGNDSGLYPKEIKERFQVDRMLDFNIGTLIPALKPYLVCSFQFHVFVFLFMFGSIWSIILF